MKNKILIFTLLLFSYAANAQEKKTVWDYPIKPGMEEWKLFESNEDMVKSCQIPEKVLSSLPTEELMELCLQYPLLYDIFAFNNTTEGFDKFFYDFNGIRELYKRQETLRALLKRYNLKIQNLSFFNEKALDMEKGFYIISVSVLEILLCHYCLRNDLSNENSIEILKYFVSGYEKKSMYADYFKGFGK